MIRTPLPSGAWQIRTPIAWLLMPLALLAVWTLAGCSSPSASDAKATVPADHEDSKEGVLHKRGADDPYAPQSWCADPSCHHVNLRGGWSYLESDGIDGGEHASAPSCYQCHGQEWEVRYPETIEILEPDASVVWRQGTSRAVEWWAPPAESTAVFLFKGGQVVEVLQEYGPADGTLRVGEVRESWGVGRDYRIRIRDSEGRGNFGHAFTICKPGNGPGVTRPNAETQLVWGDELVVRWSCASGIAVDIYIYEDGEFLDVVREGAGNTGNLRRHFPESWGTGEAFEIIVVDELGREGVSERFRIVESSPFD